MRLGARLAAPVVFVGALVAACGDGGDSTTEPDPLGSGEASDSASPTCDRACRAAQRRAERKALAAARCRELRSEVDLTYRFTATPVAGGKEVRLHLTVANRSDAEVDGATSGEFEVDEGHGPDRITWGGSSSDELYLEPGSVATAEALGRQPDQHPIGRRVTWFDFSAYLYAPGRGVVACFMPARVVAPPGLVAGHPSGRWTQRSSRPF